MMHYRSKIRSAFFNLFYFHTLSKRVYFGRKTKLHGNVRIGNSVFIDDNVEINNPTTSQSIIGDNVSINRNSVLRGSFLIGDNVAIGPNCVIIGSNHRFDLLNIPIKQQGFSIKGIVISNNVWIGANCVVLDGVKIGDGCVIGAGSIVTKTIPSNSVAFGNPCRIIRTRVNGIKE